MPETGRLVIAIDTGGTFTDAIAVFPDGERRRVKVPSDGSIRGVVTGPDRVAWPSWLPSPSRSIAGRDVLGGAAVRVASAGDDGSVVLEPRIPLVPGDSLAVASGLDAPLLAIHALLGVPLDESRIPDADRIDLRLATTRGTNALLERTAARTALVITEGLEDLLEIGDQSRPRLFALAPRKRTPIVAMSVGLPERTLADGTRRREPGDAEIDAIAARLRAAGIESVAIATAHGAAFPEAERRVAGRLSRAGFAAVAAAHATSDSPRLLARAETTVVHASLEPVLGRFLADVATRIPLEGVRVQTSAGGLQPARRFLARDLLLSGPAGGLNGVVEVASRLGLGPVLAFDMGGTSTDVARVDGEPTPREETVVADARVAAPGLEIASVAAGGGSICRVRDGELLVGPESAGASPGPACYGRGGPFTITDANLLLGRLDPSAASLPLSVPAADAAFERVRDELGRHRGETVGRVALLEAFLAIADERMARAIETVSSREGFEPMRHVLVAFGGAGGQHAASVAERLGIRTVVIPADAGFLSARGLLTARDERRASRTVLERLESVAERLEGWGRELERTAVAELESDGHDDGIAEPATALLRISGVDLAIEVPLGPMPDMEARFRRLFRERSGYEPPRRPLEVDSLRARARTPRTALADMRPTGAEPPRDGPLTIVEHGATVFVPAGWTIERLAGGDLRMERRGEVASPRTVGLAATELLACRLEGIALGMGEALRRTSISPNVKERLDYSCAVLDARGRLVVNAPHLPVHLGAMGACVRAVATELPLGPGDVAITNHPAFGGSHLPDVTTVTPVHVAGELVGFVASRAHHAEIGGTRPGSFPPDASCLAEEGVVVPPTLVVARGEDRIDAFARLLDEAPFPSRNPDENLADLRASIAANEVGVRQVAAIVGEIGRDAFRAGCDEILARGRAAVNAIAGRLGATGRRASDRLDDGSPITVEIRPSGDRLAIDFTGSAPVHPHGFNAPLAVTRAAVMYALRLASDEEIPLNEGLLEACDVIVPQGILNPGFAADPRACPPVVAGNTETSQRVTDVLLAALDLAAASQGTMNNLLFGDATYGAYETICGGAGATGDADGADAIHVHMTNTRITDVEVLERRFTVVVRTFGVRRDTGGRGTHRGGDGAIREIEFLRPASVSILSQRRLVAPPGAAGGEPGTRGRQWIVRRDGSRDAIPGVTAIELAAGEAIRIETPGGGGWGAVRGASG
jgi:5-oxoprolinase (ATP-hydrolysing)